MKKIKLLLLSILSLTFLGLNAQNALHFDGTNDYVQTTSDGISGDNARTIEVWIKATLVAKQVVVVDWGKWSTGTRFTFALMDGKPRIEISGSGYTSTTVVADETWHHIALTYDKTQASKYKLYVDGKLDQSFNLTTTLNTATDVKVRLGARVDGQKFFKGLMDEVRIWNYARTESEIAGSMNSELTGSPTGLVAYYNFNQGTAGGTNTSVTTLTDHSSNKSNGTLNGFALTGSTSNWVTGKTFSSQGATDTYSTISVTSCKDYTSPSGKYTWNTTGSYKDTIPNAAGADSIMTFDLTMATGVTKTIDITSCKDYLSPSGKYTWNTTGTFKDTIVNAVDCDTFFVVNLTVLGATSATINHSECVSFTSPSGKYTWTTSGTYNDTIPNAAGCDSVITFNLTITQAVEKTISVTSCGDYVSPSGRFTWTATGTYKDTLAFASSCDTFLIVNLTILDATSATINETACERFTSPSGNYTWTTSGTYNDTIPNAAGCDSVITVNLTINNPSSITINPTACESFTSPSGMHTWTTSGTYTDVIPNAAGCDSVITINLTINNSSSTTVSHTACESFTSPSGMYIWTSSGVYFDTIPNAVGCDSLITFNLTILTPSTSSITEDVCESFTSPSGKYTWTTSGTYYDTIPNAVGCDSMITINLTVNTVDVNVTQNGNVLTATASGVDFQWIDCDSKLPITGETNQSFTATANGNYAVVIIDNNCIDTSDCFPITNIGFEQVNFNENIKLYPNPSNGVVNIDLGMNHEELSIKIIDLAGKTLFAEQFSNVNKLRIDDQELPSGIYFVEIKSKNAMSTLKLVIE